MKVFKGKYGWETLFHNKLQNGEDVRYYMSVQFMRGFEPVAESIDIDPVRWWGSCYLTRDGDTKPKLFIAEWREILPKPEPVQNAAEYLNENEPKPEQINIDIDELPFY